MLSDSEWNCENILYRILVTFLFHFTDLLESMRSVLRRVFLGSWGDHMSPLFKKI
jgi:hypothetical protein